MMKVYNFNDNPLSYEFKILKWLFIMAIFGMFFAISVEFKIPYDAYLRGLCGIGMIFCAIKFWVSIAKELKNE